MHNLQSTTTDGTGSPASDCFTRNPSSGVLIGDFCPLIINHRWTTLIDHNRCDVFAGLHTGDSNALESVLCLCVYHKALQRYPSRDIYDFDVVFLQIYRGVRMPKIITIKEALLTRSQYNIKWCSFFSRTVCSYLNGIPFVDKVHEAGKLQIHCMMLTISS